PSPGDYVDTPDGKAVVEDVNILQNRVRTRLITEEAKGDKPEKLSSEYYIYTKEEVTKDTARKKQGRRSDPRQQNKEAEVSEKELAALED
ncbi:MAG: hypothetical protein IKX89_04440, partial [Firmicutes bacterium]|nr:hypothetical protein [Bacillota bacterium]